MYRYISFESFHIFQELYLDNNDFKVIPSGSLNGPESLKILSIRSNHIGTYNYHNIILCSSNTSYALVDLIKLDSFSVQLNLETIDLTDNLVATIESGAFAKRDNLKTLKLGHNRLTKFNSDVFNGAEKLVSLDLSNNFIGEFPSVALKTFEKLRYLNLSSNLIQVSSVLV